MILFNNNNIIIIIIIAGWVKGSGKLYYNKPHLIYMQCRFAMLTSAERQHATAVQTYNIVIYRYSLY